MAHLSAHRIYAIDDSGRDTDQTIAIVHPASEESVGAVICANPNAELGWTRSQWMWVRLQNGDLILGLFPQDDTYMMCEGDAETPVGI